MSQNYSIISIISLWVFISMPLFLEAEMFDGNFGAPRRIEESFLRDDENATKCKASLPCSDDKDCGEGGTCGGPTRKCQCRCFEKTLCKTPGLTQLANTLVNGKVKPCGGLKNACDEKTNKCECDKAYKEAGYEGTGDAFGKLCVAHSCKNDDDCHGQTCLPGLCQCPK